MTHIMYRQLYKSDRKGQNDVQKGIYTDAYTDLQFPIRLFSTFFIFRLRLSLTSTFFCILTTLNTRIWIVLLLRMHTKMYD